MHEIFVYTFKEEISKEKNYLYTQSHVVVVVVVGFMADCLMGDLGLWVGCPRWRSFLGSLASVFASFGENHGKPRTARSTSATEE